MKRNFFDKANSGDFDYISQNPKNAGANPGPAKNGETLLETILQIKARQEWEVDLAKVHRNS